MWGMDVTAVRGLGDALDQAADDLESARARIDARMGLPFGLGPDMEDFRARWSGELAPSLVRVGMALRGTAGTVRRNVEEQVAASTDAGSGGSAFAGASGSGNGSADGGGGPLDWLQDRGEDLWGAGADALDWLSDRGEDVLDGVGDWWDATSDDWLNVGDAAGQLWDATGGSILDGRWPRTTEVVASQILLLGSTGGALWTTVTGDEANIFDDGEPYAGTPSPVPDGDVRVPGSLDDLTGSVTDAYNAGDGVVRVTTVDGPGGPRVVVSVPGTQSWSPAAGANPMDLTGNLVTAGGGTSTMTQAVELAMRNADIPPGAEVLLVGHSQGGMTVADLTADPDFVSRYNVTNAVTFGSPIDSAHVDPRVSVLELQHSTDVVPRLDMEDALYVPNPAQPALPILPGLPSLSDQSGPQHSTVTLPNPGPWYDAVTNHSHQEYSSSIANSSDPALAAYEQQLRERGFLGGTAQNTNAVDVTVGRRD